MFEHLCVDICHHVSSLSSYLHPHTCWFPHLVESFVLRQCCSTAPFFCLRLFLILCPQNLFIPPFIPPSHPPPSLLPLHLSFRFILTWTRRESDLICCGLHSTESAVQSSCLSHLQVPCSDNIQRAFVCSGFTAILVALNAT